VLRNTFSKEELIGGIEVIHRYRMIDRHFKVSLLTPRKRTPHSSRKPIQVGATDVPQEWKISPRYRESDNEFAE
jgi:hypothetical protein